MSAFGGKADMAVIVAAGGAVAGLAAKAATSTIPIVVASGHDPVKYGLVESLSRPTGNITGVTLFIDVLAAKRVEILTEVAPSAVLAILINPRNPNAETESLHPLNSRFWHKADTLRSADVRFRG
jgi:putative ABC transport system substrate-binding protein